MKHKHHIVPRHMNGSDDPENLIELTIEEHAEAHRILFEQHGRWEDELAWKGLAGLISKEEIIKKVLSEAGKKGQVNRKSRKGVTYNWKNPDRKPVGTGGYKWYHDPEDTTKKGCFLEGQEIPDGWIRGQGKKAKNPGLNFHSKIAFDGPDNRKSTDKEVN